jgi:regulator of sirC expression with transglutaminase-like and TPR domain
MLAGEERPRDAVERVALAELLYAKSRHAESARMYAEAFAEDAALAEHHRYNAACSASLEAARAGTDAAEWRGRALEWLRADLDAREKARSMLVATLEHWKRDPDLAVVRDSLDELPKPEREAWRSLWAEVDRALAAARPAAR